jgi:hypothetical protein
VEPDLTLARLLGRRAVCTGSPAARGCADSGFNGLGAVWIPLLRVGSGPQAIQVGRPSGPAPASGPSRPDRPCYHCGVSAGRVSLCGRWVPSWLDCAARLGRGARTTAGRADTDGTRASGISDRTGSSAADTMVTTQELHALIANVQSWPACGPRDPSLPCTRCSLASSIATSASPCCVCGF